MEGLRLRGALGNVFIKRASLMCGSGVLERTPMLEIKRIDAGGNLKDFYNCVDTIYARDPNYVRALDMDLGERLHPKKNPFFDHGEAVFFTAHKGGKCVGRISASIDRGHNEKYDERTGFFGFIDTVNDQEVCSALITRAEEWLRHHGMTRVQGPMSLNINEEIGCLVEGFDTPPAIMMPHHHPYQGALVEGAGYKKVKDLYAWKYKVGAMTDRVKNAHKLVGEMPEVSARPLNMKNLKADILACVDIFNDAWSDNWGSVAITIPEAEKLAKDLGMVLLPELTQIICINGEPAAFAIGLPNLNEMIGDLGGKVFPFGIAKLMYRLKVVGPKSGRLMLLGVRKKYRSVRKYAYLSHYMYYAMNEKGREIGMTWGELSWTLEDNGAINMGVKSLGAEVYKRYRIYDKAL